MEKSDVEVKAKKANTELSPRQKKIWLSALFGAFVLMIGLVIAIVVVANTREITGKTCNMNKNQDRNQNEELTEQEKRDQELKTAMEKRNIVLSAIDKVLEASADVDEETVVSAYQYYISEEDNDLTKLLLRLNLVTIEASYDTDKTRGDELITVAKEIDNELKTIDSAVAIINMASFYGKNELLEEYDAILLEREKAAGINRDDDSGESKG